jgi:membrane protein
VGWLRDLAREWRDDRVSGLSAEIAFFGLLSLFPALLAMAAALGSLEAIAGADVADRAEEEVVEFLEDVLTEEASGTIRAVENLFEQTEPGVVTIGVVLAVWAASRAFAALIAALDVVYDLEEGRGYVRRRALGLALALGTVLITAVMLAMLVVGPLFGRGRGVADAIGLGSGFATFWDWARLPVAATVMIAWAATVFHIAPNHRTPWRADLPGAVFAAGAWALISVGFRVYLDVAGDTNQVLGTLGGTLIVLLWLYLLAVGLLMGGELNALLLVRRQAVANRRQSVPAEP